MEFVEQFKYLGIVMAKDDEIEIQSQYRKLCARSNILIRRFKKCNNKVKIDLFKTYCTSIYGIALWSNFRIKTLDSIRICYNNSFRYFMNYHKHCSASFMFVINNVKYFTEILRQDHWSNINIIEKIENKILSTLFFRNSFFMEDEETIYQNRFNHK